MGSNQFGLGAPMETESQMGKNSSWESNHSPSSLAFVMFWDDRSIAQFEPVLTHPRGY